MQGRGSHERALAAFRSGKVRILLGTQMIAKGLDFPNVTLVGVINADTALHLPDFRAAERTFHLVTQVAGRTGRGEKGGRVLVQTFNPEHPAIQAAVRHDYAAFAAGELPMRQMLRYPPFASMIRLVIRGPSESIAREFANFLAERLNEALQAEGGRRPSVGSRPRAVRPTARHVPFSDSASRSRRRQAPRRRAPGHRRPETAGRRAVDRRRGSGGYDVEGNREALVEILKVACAACYCSVLRSVIIWPGLSSRTQSRSKMFWLNGIPGYYRS